MGRENYLFAQTDWRSVEEHQKRSIQSEIDGIDGNRLLNTSVEDLCDYFEQKYRIDIPVLHEDRIVADQHEMQIDVSQDPVRYIRDRSRSFHVPGTLVEITVPFAGDAEAFRIEPTTYTSAPPRGDVRNNSLVLSVAGTNLEPRQVRSQIDRTLGEVRQYLGWLWANADGFNRQIRQIARERIEWRRNKLLADQNLVAGIGFPLKERADASRTFTAPEVRRRITPTMPPASTASYRPEPILSSEDYEHILSVMTNMALVMERSPSAFVAIDEEALRSHFLVQLNGHYEGQATGETFNYEGKTDILVRANGKNIFIAECKYWGGPKKLSDTIDQLLGYACWRDTKTAIVIFNRNKNFSQVLDAIPGVVKVHPNFKRELNQTGESRFCYVLAHRDDPNREMILTVLAFDVPQATKT
ncbi:hypothetical protein [Methylococcus capsulatus]|uniref:hypothetical protein n=1 Tax=Methylococcus capsulatus TaxID=414 RepID=UPI001C52B73C|nr:hypothetical protein [Methylococcus capsulatus]QXP89543.1 hypothetical protein KW114_10545 [Methylococcus capsulatus]